MTRYLRVVAPIAAVALALAGCGKSDTPGAAGGSGEPGAISGEITVFAAASLAESFAQIGKDFEAAHPGAKVTLSFGGSSALAQQINQGAPADVFASAAPANMKQVTESGAVTATPVTFVKNRLEIAVPAGNPGKVTGLADFAKAELKIGLCAAQVPCGAAAKKVFDTAGIKAAPDTLEQDVKAVLSKVSLGEVDAALVYKTDVKAAGSKVQGIEFAEADKAVNDYPIAVCAKAPNAAGARSFVDYVVSDKGRAVLGEAGFDGP
jgi:molybdate transport system substrate-binding protein